MPACALRLTAPTVLLALLAISGPASAGSAVLGFAGRFEAPVVSFAERPYQTVIRQQFDYSCGSAALATLLTHHYRQPPAAAPRAPRPPVGWSLAGDGASTPVGAAPARTRRFPRGTAQNLV